MFFTARSENQTIADCFGFCYVVWLYFLGLLTMYYCVVRPLVGTENLLELTLFFIVANPIYKMKTMGIEHNTSLVFFIILSLSSEIIPTLSPCHCKNPSGSLLTTIITTQIREKYYFSPIIWNIVSSLKKKEQYTCQKYFGNGTKSSLDWIQTAPGLFNWLWVCLIFPIFPDIGALLTDFERDLVWAKMTLNGRKTL